ncbi:helix-turn-helix domain-containing protein [Herbiconiux sp. P17]|uniref:helix-turn-helix domain-containing protein n=1 Tax=Herbiconiux wuyangfengii TaxID=3342794 RepID=UPI0035B9875C
MSNQQDVREFLESRRARISPEQAGLPNFGGTRRVPGLRRTEVAMLAGVSPEYYTRLERGNLSGVSANVLEGLARALSLDEAERAHLFDLARAASAGPMRPRRRAQVHVRPSIQRILDAITGAPAFIRNGRFDVLAENALGSALYAPLNESPERPVNHARYIFLDPNAPAFWGDWDRVTRDTVAILRAEAGRDPYDRGLTDLIGELSTRSELFRTLWAAHDVRFHRSGTKVFHHPIVGELELAYEGFDLPADPGLTMLTYSAEPGTASADALNLLATWAATQRSERAASASSAASSATTTDASLEADTQA